ARARHEARARRLAGLEAGQRRRLAEAARLDGQARAFGRQHRYAEAIPLARKALEARRALLGEDDGDHRLSSTSLGWLHFGAGDYAKAERLLERALNSCKEGLGPIHPLQDARSRLRGWLRVAKGDTSNAFSDFYHLGRFPGRALGEERPAHLA